MRRFILATTVFIASGLGGCASANRASCSKGDCEDEDEDQDEAVEGEDEGEEDEDESSGTGEGSGTTGAEDVCDHSEPPKIVGKLITSVTSLEFNEVTVELGHKRDIDPEEDGCINDIRLTFGVGEGCTLVVHASDTLTPQHRLSITAAEFTADSQCPDFPDALEGVYQDAGGLSLDGSGIEGPRSIPEQNVASACFPAELGLRLSGTLDRPGAGDPLEIEPSLIRIAGDLRSKALEQPCPRGTA